jgi:hypothetical protein
MIAYSLGELELVVTGPYETDEGKWAVIGPARQGDTSRHAFVYNSYLIAVRAMNEWRTELYYTSKEQWDAPRRQALSRIPTNLCDHRWMVYEIDNAMAVESQQGGVYVNGNGTAHSGG